MSPQEREERYSLLCNKHTGVDLRKPARTWSDQEQEKETKTLGHLKKRCSDNPGTSAFLKPSTCNSPSGRRRQVRRPGGVREGNYEERACRDQEPIRSCSCVAPPGPAGIFLSYRSLQSCLGGGKWKGVGEGTEYIAPPEGRRRGGGT